MMRRYRTRAAVLALIAAAALMVSIPGAGMASGAVTAGSPTAGVSGQVLHFTKSNGNGTMTTITCTGQSDYPHVSVQQPGTVHGKSRSWCSAPIGQVHVQSSLWLYLPGWGYSEVGIGSLDYCFNCTGAASPKLQSIAIDICRGSAQYYRTTGRHHFVAPPGYSPPSITFYTGTPGMEVIC